MQKSVCSIPLLYWKMVTYASTKTYYLPVDLGNGNSLPFPRYRSHKIGWYVTVTFCRTSAFTTHRSQLDVTGVEQPQNVRVDAVASCKQRPRGLPRIRFPCRCGPCRRHLATLMPGRPMRAKDACVLTHRFDVVSYLSILYVICVLII